MTHAHTFTGLAAATVIAGWIAGNAAAQTAEEAAELTAAGFSHVGNDVWQSIDEDGIVRRIGFGVRSEQALLDNLHAVEKRALEADFGSTMAASIADLHQSISTLEARQEAKRVGGGGFGTCGSTPTALSASINTGTRTATATTSGSGFGPAEPGWIRIVSSYASPSSNPFAIQGTLSTGYITNGISVSSTATPSASTCTFYSYAHIFRVGADCGAWADAYQQVPSC